MAKTLVRLDPDEATSLYGRPVTDDLISYETREPRATIALIVVAWFSTAALAFMVGRASIQPEAGAEVRLATLEQANAPPPPTNVGPSAPASVGESAKASEANSYPRFVSTIPVAFRGAWDEIVNDKCLGREPRYALGGTTFENFEIVTDVERVKLVNPSEIEINVTGYDTNKNQYNDIIGFRLLDGGRTLTGTEPDSNFYRRCP